MCSFCELKENWESVYIGEVIENHACGYAPMLFIEKYNGDKFYLVASGEERTKFEITVCPICGNTPKVIKEKK